MKNNDNVNQKSIIWNGDLTVAIRNSHVYRYFGKITLNPFESKHERFFFVTTTIVVKSKLWYLNVYSEWGKGLRVNLILNEMISISLRKIFQPVSRPFQSTMQNPFFHTNNKTDIKSFKK